MGGASLERKPKEPSKSLSCPTSCIRPPTTVQHQQHRFDSSQDSAAACSQPATAALCSTPTLPRSPSKALGAAGKQLWRPDKAPKVGGGCWGCGGERCCSSGRRAGGERAGCEPRTERWGRGCQICPAEHRPEASCCLIPAWLLARHALQPALGAAGQPHCPAAGDGTPPAANSTALGPFLSWALEGRRAGLVAFTTVASPAAALASAGIPAGHSPE